MQDLSRDLFLDKRIDDASSKDYRLDVSQSRMSRREFGKYAAATVDALGLSYVASKLPRVYGSDTLVIPKLSYDPTIDQLKSDWELQRKMVTVDLKATNNAPVYGKCAMGFDSSYVDFIGARTSQGAGPFSQILLQIFLDRDHSGGSKPDADDFVVLCGMNIQQQVKSVALVEGTGAGWGDPKPSTFPGDIIRTRSYFSPDQENYLAAVQIPISDWGSGGPGGLYGFGVGMQEDLKKVYPSYPNEGNGGNPSTWTTVATAQPLPFFPSGLEIPTVAASLFLTGIAIRQRRMSKFRK